MAKINLPGLSQGMTVRPPLPPGAPLSDYVQQAIALLLGYTYGETVVLHASPAGVLYVAEPRVSDTFQWTAVGDDESHQGDNIQATEILLVASPDNTGNVYVRTRSAASETNSVILGKGMSLTMSVENLNELYVLIATTGDTISVMYSL